MHPASRLGILTGAVLGGLLALAGCFATGDTAPSTANQAATSLPSATAEASSDPPSAQVDPDGTALDNLDVFTAITERVWDSEARASGRAYVDALTEAGFERDAMQVTEDASTVGNAAESLQFSVRWGDDCLIGQVGPATGDPVTGVFDGLPEGRCLIGHTRPIDW